MTEWIAGYTETKEQLDNQTKGERGVYSKANKER